MDSRLLEACQTGNAQILHQLLGENPLLLHKVSLSSTENPLHVASIAGHVAFAKEIMRLRPEFVREFNQDGFSPIHIASANGYSEIVREILTVDRRLSLLEGRNKWTPLHFAASRGRSDVIREIAWACPESFEDVTAQKETALHVAVKSNQFEAIDVMLRLVREMRKDEILHIVDELGNSVLHWATWRKNRQVVEWLIGSTTTSSSGTTSLLNVNAVNKSGLTPLDLLLIFPSEAGDREIEDLLRSVGAKQAKDAPSSPFPSFEIDTTQPLQPRHCETESGGDDLVEYFKFKKGRDTPSDARTALLVIAVLVATATFQVGVNPPSGVWQDSYTKGNGTSGIPTHNAGTSIMGSSSSVSYLIFVIFNSTGLSVSLYMLTVLTSDFPMHFEFEICVIALYFTYYLALGFMAPDNLRTFIIVFSAVVPATGYHLIKLLRQLIKRLTRVISAIKVVICHRISR